MLKIKLMLHAKLALVSMKLVLKMSMAAIVFWFIAMILVILSLLISYVLILLIVKHLSTVIFVISGLTIGILLRHIVEVCEE